MDIVVFEIYTKRYIILIPQYEYDIVVITRVWGKAEYEC